MYQKTIFILLASMMPILTAWHPSNDCKFNPHHPAATVDAFLAFIKQYNAHALEQIFSLDLDRAFSLVDRGYHFKPREHNYLFEFDMPVPLEMRKQMIASYFLTPGDSALDVGAFLGTYSFFYHFIVTNTGCVIAFEPNPTPFHALQEMLLQRGNCNILLEPKALSQRAGEKVLMEVHPGTLEQNSTLETTLMNRFSGPNILIEVETESLDHILDAAAAKMERLKLIKLDTEGHETAILEGGKKLIQSLRPVMILEYGTIPGTFEPRSIEILEELGYICYDLKYVNVVHAGYQSTTGTDLLALPKERLEEFNYYVKPVLLAIQ